MADYGISLSGLDLISSAGRLANILAAGEVFAADEAQDALLTLNQLIDEWNAEDLMIYTVNRNVFTLTPSQQVYTLGPNGNFNITRPAKIERWSVIDLTNPGQPLEIPMGDMLTEEQWQAIPVKNITNIWPYSCYDDGNFPLRNLSFFPIPTQANQVVISTWSPLTTYSDLNLVITYPPGYFKALRYNLAVELGAAYKSDMSPAIMAIAVSSKARVKLMNCDPITLKCDEALRPTPLGGGTDPYAIIRGF